jgi:hypothetical protein
MDIWLPKERKVLLAQFLDTTMAQDVDPTGKDSFVKDFWRKKTYTKDSDKLLPFMNRDFSEPYMVAQHYCGGTWNDYNQPFIVQVAQCNLACRWCFVPHRLRDASEGRYFSAKGVVELFGQNTPEDHGILRISGGEPFLAPDFLIDIGKQMAKLPAHKYYLWIDTNLCGKDYDRVISALSHERIPFGVCGCFKGFDRHTFVANMEDQFVHEHDTATLFASQFIHARIILEWLNNYPHGQGELFFYVPEIVYHVKPFIKTLVNSFIERLSNEVHINAPLRTTVLRVKEYDSNKGAITADRVESRLTKQIWNECVEAKYPLELRWIPQYQVSMQLEKEG